MNSAELDRLIKSSEELIKKWDQVYFQEMSDYFREQMTIFEGIRNNFSNFEKTNSNSSNTNSLEFASEVLELHTSNLSLLKKHSTELKSKNESKEFTSRIKLGVLNDVHNLQFSIIDEYNTKAAYSENGIGSKRFLRKTGNFFYNLRSLPRKTRNWFARLFKKPAKPLKTRYHTVYFQHIVKGFLLDEYISCLQKNTFEIQKKLILYAHSLFELESNLIIEKYNIENSYNLPKKSPNLNEQFKDIEKFYSEYKKTFTTLLGKSGTWEFPLFYIRYRLKRNFKQTFILADSTFRLWDSTFYAFYEDWRFREELFSFISRIKIQASHTLMNYSAKLNKTLIPVITKKREYLEQLIDRIPNPDNTDLSALKHFFTSELYILHKETRNQTTEEDLNKTCSEIEKLLQKIEVDITEVLEKLPNKSGVVRSPDYEKGIRKSEIYFFSPVEFVEFECLPPFISKVNSFIEDFKINFKEIVHEFSDFDQISDFTLDTAVSMINAQNSPEQIVLMSREGMKRSLNILDRISELGNETLNTKEKDLTQIFTHFVENVKKLDNNDSILNIYSSLLKSKAIQESKDKRKKIAGFLSSSALFLTSLIKRNVNTILNLYMGIRKKLKLDKAPVYVSSEISNYLSDINKRIYNLPVIYRYLFENAPVKEVNLFLSRDNEIDKLNNAFKDWRYGNYAATLLIGENGGGKSSLLKYYLKTIKGNFKIRHLPVSRFYSDENDFYELMQDIFENNNLKTEQDVLKEINTAKGQQIIVLDGLERVFLRRPGGFDCLHKLLSFIVSTNNQAFWICSVSLHACNYLNKTISLKENFDYLVELNNLSSDEVKNIVLKRHRLSGYIVQYEDDLIHLSDNKKNKDRQNQLETEFFNELNRFADSNISLSLYYWLEAVSEFTDKEFFIKRFQTPDFSFLETLSAEKIYTLLLIVLHGRITIELHARICNQKMEKSRKVLTILKEDSIVILKGDYYILNGILYRHVVQLLKNKNLIH